MVVLGFPEFIILLGVHLEPYKCDWHALFHSSCISVVPCM